MKLFARFSLMGSGLGLILLTATPSFATVVGNLYVGGTGTVSVTPTGITFTENDTAGGSTEVGTGTTLTYAGGALTVGQPVDIGGGLAIAPTGPPVGGAYPVNVPITFPDEPTLSILLTSFGPGSSNTNCAGLTNGESCSPLIAGGPSPIILTAVGSGTDALLFVSGTATDGTTVTDIAGSFAATIPGISPAQLASDGSFTTTYSGSFTLTATPEPRTISLMLFAGLLMGFVAMKRRKKEVQEAQQA